jgi:hypothetical protein
MKSIKFHNFYKIDQISYFLEREAEGIIKLKELKF